MIIDKSVANVGIKFILANILYLVLNKSVAEVTQLVEYLPSKQAAAGSSPVFRSIKGS